MTHATSPTRPFGALLTAMVTPMHPDGALDIDSAVELAKHLAAHGHDGLVLNGTTGEAPTTHAPEKAELVAAVVEAVGEDVVVVAGAGSNDTAHAVRMAEQAEQAGAHGLLVVTPYYSRPSQEGIYRHTVAVADATDLPVMLYDVPGRTAVQYAPDTLRRLAEHARIVAVKDATGKASAIVEPVSSTGLAYYSGDDGELLSFLANGAVGIVSMAAHVVGDEFADVIRRFDAGDHAGALKVFAGILPAIDLICGSGNGALRSKAVLHCLGLIAHPSMRLPHAEAGPEEREQIAAAVEALGLGEGL